jgi:hypothetical protein
MEFKTPQKKASPFHFTKKKKQKQQQRETIVKTNEVMTKANANMDESADDDEYDDDDSETIHPGNDQDVALDHSMMDDEVEEARSKVAEALRSNQSLSDRSSRSSRGLSARSQEQEEESANMIEKLRQDMIDRNEYHQLDVFDTLRSHLQKRIQWHARASSRPSKEVTVTKKQVLYVCT